MFEAFADLVFEFWWAAIMSRHQQPDSGGVVIAEPCQQLRAAVGVAGDSATHIVVAMFAQTFQQLRRAAGVASQRAQLGLVEAPQACDVCTG